MNEKLLGLLRRQEAIYREAYDVAQAANVEAHDAGKSSPYSQAEMIALELQMLDAQIELARVEGESQPNTKRGG